MTRVCLFTGAGGLLGSAWCQTLAGEYAIVASYHTEPPRSSTQDSRLLDPLAPRRPVPESEHQVFAVRADLTDPSQIDRLVELAMARFGRVDVLVNAAGDVRSRAEITDPRLIDAWARQLVLNALVPVQVAAAVAHAFWRGDEAGNRAHRRNVINVSSTAGLPGFVPTPGRAIYAASKAALNVLTRRMAIDYQRFGVRVNAVAPTNFPHVLPTADVIESLRRLDSGRMTGRVLVLEADQTRWL